jgi:hypothetical protein
MSLLIAGLWCVVDIIITDLFFSGAYEIKYYMLLENSNEVPAFIVLSG